jgi:hypothetical protein
MLPWLHGTPKTGNCIVSIPLSIKENDMKTRKNTTTHPYQHPRHNIAPRTVITFIALGDIHTPTEVFYFDFLLFRILRITNTTRSKLTVTDLIVNREFKPGAMLTDWFYLLRFPVVLEERAYFEAVLQPPSVADLPPDCSYLKLPAVLTLSTNRGEFSFQGGKNISCEERDTL